MASDQMIAFGMCRRASPRLLGGGAHRVVPEDREEHGGRPGDRAAHAEREERRVVAGLHVEEADHDHQQHHDDLQPDHERLEPRRGLDAPVEQVRDEQAERRREQVDAVPVAGARCAEHPGRQVGAQLGDQEAEVAGDADRHHRHDGGVLQQQVPADEPADRLAQHGVAVGVGRAGLRDHAGELRVRQRGGGAGQARDQERHQHGRTGGLVGHRAREREDAGADDAADPDRGELPQAQLAGEPLLGLVGDLFHRLTPEDAPSNGHGDPSRRAATLPSRGHAATRRGHATARR